MKKLIFIFLLWFSPLFSFGAINECLTDIYFANGILTNEGNATANTDLLRLAIFTETYAGNIDRFENDIGKVKEAYNSTHGSYWDFIESAAEKWGMQWLKDKLWDTVHEADLDLQVKHYKESIRQGHKVLIVAHSQGNLFTNDAYKEILGDSNDWWMTPYFKIVSVASPMHFMITLDTPEISWDNDLVADLGLDLMSGRTYSPVRKIKWEFYDGVPIDSRVARPRHNYVYSNKVNEIYKGSWKPVEGLLQKFDSNVHAFTFYMDKPIKDGNTGEIFYNPFDENKTLQTDIAKTKIMTAIKTQLDNLKKVTSQWTTDQEFDKNTCDYKITLKHQYDPSIERGEKVYPFNIDGKLYQVNGEWVKASCGGENIIDLQDNNSSECWMIDNPEEEKIGFGKTIKFYAYFNFSFDNDYYTWPYISSSFIADTYSTEITSLAQWREIRPNQRECRTQSGIAGGSNSGYFYFNSDVTVKRIEDIHIFGGHYNLQPYKYTIKCILNKNQKNLDDIEKIEKGKVTYEEFHGSNGFASRDGIYFNKLYLIEYFIHTK